MRNFRILFSIMLLFSFGCSKSGEDQSSTEKPDNSDSPAGVYISSVISRLNFSESIIGDISDAAEAAAKCAVQGGKIYVTDDETVNRTGEEETQLYSGGGLEYPMHEDWGGFVAEACDRAGGLRHIQPVPLSNDVQEHDIVLVGTVDLKPEEQSAQIKILKGKGALVIVFGSRDSRIAALGDYLIDNGLDAGFVPVIKIGETMIGPTAPMANVINKWLFTAEYVAALTRAGKMPAFWQSMLMPGAAARNKKIGDFVYHTDMDIPPVKPGISARQYISAVRGYLVKIQENELNLFRQAGTLCAETIQSGNKVVASVIGHFMAAQLRMPDYPDIFTVLTTEFGRESLEGVLGKGDTWLHVGYSYTPEQELLYAQEIGAGTICVLTPGPTVVDEGTPVAPDMNLIDLYIDPYWKIGDSVVEIPGYDTKIIPPSGVVMITSFWMIIGETMKNL